MACEDFSTARESILRTWPMIVLGMGCTSVWTRMVQKPTILPIHRMNSVLMSSGVRLAGGTWPFAFYFEPPS